jgi:DNA-binding response OmpR family regulator
VETEEPRRLVLVCEDEPGPREAIAWIAARAGAAVIEAADGEEAVRLALERRPRLILLDIDLPRKDGLAVCREIRAHALPCRAHVLILTAYSIETQREKAMAAGADELMAKPFGARDLRRRIEEILAAGREEGS